MESHGVLVRGTGTETSQHPRSPMESLVRRLVSYHGSTMESLVWKLVNTHGVPRRVG